MPVSARAKKINPSLGDYWEARLIEVEYAGKIRRYITSLTDSKVYPFKDLAMLYIQRWEIEMCYREIKSDLQDARILEANNLIWSIKNCGGVFIAYNILRRQMEFIAEHAKGEIL